MNYKTTNKYLTLLNIDELLHYYKVSGTERAIKVYNIFYKDLLDFKTENKLIRSIKTNNKALLENTVQDIKRESIKYLRNNL